MIWQICEINFKKNKKLEIKESILSELNSI